MLLRKVLIIFLLKTGFVIPGQAEEAALRHFTSGSYQQMLQNHTDKPVMLSIWSTTCSTCLEKMPLLSELRSNQPDVSIILLSVDDAADEEQVQAILSENGLTDLENWIFADENAQRLRHEIDPLWFGELPRTYFLNNDHEREGISGALSSEDYQSIFKILVN
ncbi:TlpA family protein disulfide reductase [Nitrosomonas marina]|uniref:Thiol-disulfide isomerase or thioredoxin n=1 Tax=Nitrosomonas marina TaxID=917 RepID=A0A1H8HMN8_9PROT|nr:thioredoxin-like domain-containing protein [Nitrosomonas marina]SEN57449.1 Thiol-disulfide isomerase or thioredoxin [Nitrosomonas marina]